MSSLPRQQLRLQSDRLAELSDAERAIVQSRRSLIDAWRNMTRDFLAAGHKKIDATAAFLAVHPDISRATLYRWNGARDSDDPVDLLDRRSKSVRPSLADSSKLIADSCTDAAWQRFCALWLTIRRVPTSVCWMIVNEEAKQHGWNWPKLRTIQRRCRADLPPYKSDYFRYGEREWARRHAPKIARDYSLYRANEWWVGDFHEFDVFCRTSDTNPTIVRPLLSAFIDLRSRVLVGWFICLAENADNILQAVRHGCQLYGVPDHIIIDNGKPYRSYGVSGGRPTLRRKVEDEEYVRSVFGGLGICTHFSIPFNPDSKLIERWFGTLESSLCCTFESYCGPDKDDRFRAAHKLALDHPERCPTVAKLTLKFAAWLEAYHSTPHSGEGMNGMSPATAFEQCDPIARKVAPEGALDLLLLRPHGQHRSKDGVLHGVTVTCNGVLYQGDRYGQREEALRAWQGKEVLLRVDPNDAGWVLVCDLEGKPIVRAYNNRRFFAEVTQDNIRDGMKAKAQARKVAKSLRDGILQPMHQDTTTAAIAAKLAAGQREQTARAVRTGTDNLSPSQGGIQGGSCGTGVSPVRNVQPLRSDFADVMEQFNRQAAQIRGRAMADIVEQRPPLTFEQTVDDLCAANADATADPFDLADVEGEL